MRGIKLAIALATLGSGLAVAGGTPAEAGQPSSNVIEQHWELLAEGVTVPSTKSSQDVLVHRGALPGGTTKFDPAPTATLEVVGRHSGGSGSARWDVSLVGGPNTLATVQFPVDSSSWSIQTAAIAWPSTTMPLRRLVATRVQPGLSLAGSLEIKKAYIKFHQEGTIHKTVGRIPVAVRQNGITNASWQTLTDPVYYRHSAGDIDVDTSIYLRSTGVELTANPILQTLHIRLVDSDGTVVPHSELSHAQLGSVQSPPLSLEDDETYRVQVKVTSIPQNGDLYSAELVFEQAATDSGGLRRSLSFFPSVTSAVQLTSPGGNLNFSMRAPMINAPEVRADWTSTIRRGVGTTGIVAVHLDHPQGNFAISGPSAGSGQFTWEEAPPQVWPTLPSDPNHTLESISEVAAGANGRVTASALRIATELHINSPPLIVNFSPGYSAFSPNGDGVKDHTTVTATITDVTLSGWTLTIANAQGIGVRTVEPDAVGSAEDLDFDWLGTDDAGAIVPDGVYTMTLAAVDAAQNIASDVMTVIVDTVAPLVRRGRFFPQDHGNTVFTSQPLTAELEHGSGASLDTSSIGFWITDTTTGIRSALAVSQFDPVTGVAVSEPAELILGRVYRGEVSVADVAGNLQTYIQDPASTGGGFLVAEMTPESATVTFDSSARNTGVPGASSDTQVWLVIPNVTLSRRHVSLPHGSQHAGWGTLSTEVPIDGLSLEIKRSGLWGPSDVLLYPQGETRQILQQFAYVDADGAALSSLPVGVARHNLTALEVDLPSDVDEARLVGSPVSGTSQFVGLDVVPDLPLSGFSPDPLRFYLQNEVAVAAVEVNSEAEGTVENAFGLVAGRAPIEGIDDTDKGMIWSPVSGLLGACVGGDPLNQVCTYLGVYYSLSSNVFTEARMHFACPAMLRCAYVSASGTPGEEAVQRWKCIDRVLGFDRDASVAGEHNPTDPSDPDVPCSQGYWQHTHAQKSSSRNADGNWLYKFDRVAASDWGFQDGEFDEIGVHFTTNDPQQRWHRAKASDAQWFFTTSHSIVATPFWVGIYPQSTSSQSGMPYQAAYEAAFSVDFGVSREFREFCDDSPDGDGDVCKSGYGSGQKAENGKRGWKQYYRDPNGAKAGSIPVHYRSRETRMTVVMELLDDCRPTRCAGQQQFNGHLLSTWGHMYKSFSYSWNWLYAIVQCGAAHTYGGSCDPIGLVFSTLSQEENREHVFTYEVFNAFSYE